MRISAFMATVLLGASLTACASVPGPYNGLGTDGMSMVVAHKNPDYGPWTRLDYKIVNKHVDSCLEDVRRQQAGLGETMLTSGVVNGVAAGGGEAGGYKAEAGILGAHLAKHAIPAVAAGTAIVAGAQGAANGALIKSQGVTSIVGSCANGDLHDARTAAKIQGVHVYGSFVRTNNHSDQLPDWIVREDSGEPVEPAYQHPDTTDPASH